MTEELATSPVDEADEPVETEVEAETNEVEETEPELDDDGNPIETEPEYEEFEFEGQTLTVTAEQRKALEEGALRQADYTKKTQTVAEQRAELEAQQAEFEARRDMFSNVSQAEQAALNKLLSLDARLSEYQGLDLAAIHARDPNQAAQIRYDMDALKEQREGAEQEFRQVNQQRTQAEQQEYAKQVEKAQQVLVEKIGWNPEIQEQVFQGSQSEYGFKAEEIGSEVDPRVIEMAHDALQWRKHQKQLKATQKADASKGVQPAKKVRGGSPQTTPLHKVTDPEEYRKRRMAQLSKAK